MSELNLQEKAIKEISQMREYIQRGKFELENLLNWMRDKGTSVLINWGEGEDSDLWECSWITSGKRYVSHKETVSAAVADSFLKGTDYAVAAGKHNAGVIKQWAEEDKDKPSPFRPKSRWT
jgi:hypothetical protein